MEELNLKQIVEQYPDLRPAPLARTTADAAFLQLPFLNQKATPEGVSLFGGGKRHILAQGARASRHEKNK